MEIVLSCGIEQRSLLGIKDATFAEAETLLHGHSFVQTIDLILFKSSYQTKRGSLNMIRWTNGNNQEPGRLCFILRKHFSIYVELKLIM